jgi:hypothetical protein
MNLNTITDSFMLQLYLESNIYNIILKIKHKFYIATGSPAPQSKILGTHLVFAIVPRKE